MNETPSQPFPPAPWHLQGSACASLWQVAAASLPQAGPAPLRLAGRLLVLTVWARYTEGTLAYDELALAVLQRARPAPSLTVGPIWVSDSHAAAGGRALWSIPKVLGEFTTCTSDRRFTGQLSQAGTAIATLEFTSRMALPGRLPLVGHALQRGAAGHLCSARCSARGRLVLGNAAWDFSAEGPLSFLRGRRPLASLRLESLRLVFGT
ncbi:acetoacetate decarboxylase family protein [Stutzerimonas tarimensis]|uniref:Acetoacetate decarboxylase family protein n=1 Tax=Stutzerimonas tarimensis TaxID=1507735 RepID=A0ABV7SZE9_9GAMM